MDAVLVNFRLLRFDCIQFEEKKNKGKKKICSHSVRSVVALKAGKDEVETAACGKDHGDET